MHIALADGTLIDAHTGKRTVSTEINKAFSDKPKTSMLKSASSSNFDGGTRRFIDDLPVPPNQSRAIAIIAAYSVFGLSAADISYVIGVELEVVEAILTSDGYNKFMEGVLQNIREHDKDVVRRKINEAASRAVETITDIAEKGSPALKLKASMDILDRHSDNVSGANGKSNSAGLTIRIVDDRANPIDKVEVDIDA